MSALGELQVGSSRAGSSRPIPFFKVVILGTFYAAVYLAAT